MFTIFRVIDFGVIGRTCVISNCLTLNLSVTEVIFSAALVTLHDLFQCHLPVYTYLMGRSNYLVFVVLLALVRSEFSLEMQSFHFVPLLSEEL